MIINDSRIIFLHFPISGIALLNIRTENQLDMLIDAIIDLEALIQMMLQTQDDLVNDILVKARDILLANILRARFVETSEEYYSNLSSLVIDPFYINQKIDEPSIKMVNFSF